MIEVKDITKNLKFFILHAFQFIAKLLQINEDGDVLLFLLDDLISFSRSQLGWFGRQVQHKQTF